MAAGLFAQGLSAQTLIDQMVVDQTRTRVKGPVDRSVASKVAGSTHRAIRNARDMGRVASELPMERMQLLLSSSPEQQAAVEQLIRDQQDSSSPRYHQWLSPQQFGEQFGPTQAELDAVTSWLRNSGFTVDQIANSRRIIEFSGTAGQVEQVFQTELHQYSVNGETHMANATDISVPAALAEVVAGVVSLHDFRLRPQHHVLGTAESRTPAYTSTSGAHTITPYDFATIYDVVPVWNTLKIDGTGQSIAVVARSNISQADVNAFRLDYGMPPASLQVVLNGKDPGILTKSGDDVEATLDTEWSGGIATGAKVILVVSASTRISDGVDLSATYIVDNNTAPVITYSYGTCEAQNGTANSYYFSLWQQAVAQGMSVFVSAGDNGSAGCDDPTLLTPAVSGFGVSGLASTPYNVAVGGTEFLEVGAGPFWSATNTTGQVSSALGYIPETAWNESAYSGLGNANNGLWAGGGGVSTIYQTPVWQIAPGVPAADPGTTNQHHRYLPDVSFTAAEHDGYRVRVEGTTYLVSGTSASTPSFAGVMALINQYTGTKNGLAAPRLYALANSNPTIFHDVTVGNNAVPCDSTILTDLGCTGPPITATVATMGGYSAGPGYDLATGLGSVDVYQLVTNWSTSATGGGSSGNTGGNTGGGTSGGTGGNTGGNTGTPGTPPPAGVISLSGAHLATGGGWQTQIELINPSSAPATAHLRIYDDNGNTLSIPLVSADGTINTKASGLDPQLGAKSVLILQSAAPASGPVLQGSAAVTADGPIAGFLIYTYTPSGQQVLVPLSSGAATTYSLAFDNTGGLSTGLALANSSTQAVQVGVTALDQNGRTLVNSSVTIPALGHQSFVASTQFSSLGNQHGTLQFTPPAGAQISLIGIRATAAGEFTGIPLLASAATGGGTLADLASGGGWTTLIQLVNTSSSTAQAHLKFYGDNGAPLSLPISSTDIPLNQNVSAVDVSLLPSGSVLLQSAGTASSSLLSGSALSLSDPGITGFLIFRYNTTGGQVLVPMETGTPNSYLLAFDQSNGLATGIALSNSATGAASVTAYLRDQNGNMFDSSVITLPSQGHKAFVLADLFPTAAGKYGTIQFVPPSGQQMGVAGIRYTPAGAFTSIPVLTP